MRRRTSNRSATAGALIATVAAVVVAGGISPVNAQKPDDDKGRYTLSPVDGGFIRLDTQTGAVALCTGKDSAWSCEPLTDRSATAAATQAAKLESENKDLRARVEALEAERKSSPPSSAPPPPGDAPPIDPGNGPAQLPTEEEIDKALDYVERVFKKFRDRIEKYQTPTPTPESPLNAPSAPPSAPNPDDKPATSPDSGSGAL